LEQHFRVHKGVRVGHAKRIGEGLAREVYAAQVEFSPDSERRSGVYVVLLPQAGWPDPDLNKRTRHQARVLEALRGQLLPFRIPEVIGAVQTDLGLALIQRYLEGIPVDLRAGRMPSIRPWEIVGELAASVHRCSLPEEVCPGSATRREHALQALR